jgi:hypothetical protein
MSGASDESHVRRERVSACLIVQNEQRNLPGALDSVGFCDEIVVVDGGSSDRTVEIAREYGAVVIENPWPGFAAQRNVALDAATSEWVFELDADERVDSRLRASIQELLASPPEGVAIAVSPLRHWFLGRLLGASAKYPAYRSRLFKRAAYRHDESRGVHEGLEPHERPAILDGDLEHELARTLREALRDVWRYARLESEHLRRTSNPSAYLKGIVLRPASKIAYRILVDQGWRDGWQGTLKILLDASSDAIVWIRVLTTKARSSSAGAPPQSGDTGERHFGRRPAGRGKVVGLARRGNSARRARQWLSELQANGVDVTLVSDELDSGGCIPARRVRSLWPLATMRALDVEMQLRTIHAVVPFGRRARFVCRLLPGSLRPQIANLNAESDPAQVDCLLAISR